MSNFTNSPLIDLTHLSPHHNSPRNRPITKITIHHTAGNIGLEALGSWLSRLAAQASYNYGISTDGRIAMFVEERNRSWASSSPANDHQAITIGVANNSGVPNWTVSDASFDALIRLCVDICKRNNIDQLIYDGTPNGSLTRHNMFTNTICPGPHLQGRFAAICNLVNAMLEANKLPADLPAGNFPLEAANIQRMVELDIIHSPEFWQNVNSVEWLNELLGVAGKDRHLHKNVDNGITDLETALKVLHQAGIMNSPDYWRNQTKSSPIEFLGQLIINIANRSINPLERIIWAEARGEDSKGQIMVANVIMNRHKSDRFPNGFYNVIFEPNQFSPIKNGAYNRATPTPTQRDAVISALDGTDHSRGATFFHSARSLTPDSWHERAVAEGILVHLFDHGNHRFYKNS